MNKRQILLGVLIVALLGILIFELYIIFIKKPANTAQNQVEQTVLNKDLSNLYTKVPEKQVQNIMQGFTRQVESLKPLLRSGVLKELEVTEVYKSIIVHNGKTNTERKLVDGTVAKANYLISFASMAEDGRKEHGYLFTDKDLALIQAYTLQGEEEIEIPLEQILPGDFVSISMTTNVLLRPEDSLVRLKIVKLL